MIANCHLGFNCVNIEESIKFYEKYFGMREKFVLSYADLIREVERSGDFGPNYEKFPNYERFKGYAEKGIIWLAYMEWPENPGYFIELFYGDGQEQTRVPNLVDIGYTHFAIVIEDLEALRKRIIDAGGEEYLETGISLGIDGTYQMWMHDPDGNKFELMQYTERSLQLVGKPE